MKTYTETITWYDATEVKPRDMERVLITVGDTEQFRFDIGHWKEAEQRWYFGNDEGGVPGAFIWSWARLPKAIKFN